MADDERYSPDEYRASVKIAVIIPARNEASNLPLIMADLVALGVDKDCLDIVICDNGSSDSTAAVAEQLGARVVNEPVPGYGGACLAAMAALRRPDIVVFADADQHVPLDEWQALLRGIEQGADLVVGCRSAWEAGAMTPQQHVGNRFATGLIRLLFGFPVTDLGPFRAIRFQVLEQLSMQDRSYGWTVEMQLKAWLGDFAVLEVPVKARCRVHGKSIVSGTLRGTIGAGIGIIGTIIKSTGWSVLRRGQEQ